MKSKDNIWVFINKSDETDLGKIAWILSLVVEICFEYMINGMMVNI